MIHRQPLDARQEAQAAFLLEQNGWIRRQPMWLRVLVWLAVAATWPSVLIGVFAALAGGNAWLAWLATSGLAAVLYSFPIFWPERAARFGARQLMTEVEEEKIRNLPPQHPGRIP